MPSEAKKGGQETSHYSMPMRPKIKTHDIPQELAGSSHDDDATDNSHHSNTHRPHYHEEFQSLDHGTAQNNNSHEFSAVISAHRTSISNHDLTFTDHDAIASRDHMKPSLLQLPPELRNLIWELAFGHRTVHPRALRGNMDWQPQRRRLNTSKWGVSYDPCMETQSDYELYSLSLQDPETDYWHEDMCPASGAPGFHNCEQEPPREYHYLVPPVCKQIWNEASDCVWKTITFAFVTSGDFQHFVLFSGARLDQIRQLCIITPGIDFFAGRALADKDKFERSWERALKSGVMEQFTSLAGLHLVLRSFWGTPRWSTSTVENLEFPPDECLYLPEIIRVFQALRLHPERTTVLVTNADSSEAYGWEYFTVPKRRRMAQVIRDFLLQETPDRDWSGVGQSMMVWGRG